MPVRDDGADAGSGCMNGIGIGSIDGLGSEEICVGKACDERIKSEDESNVVAKHHHRRHDDDNDNDEHGKISAGSS